MEKLTELEKDFFGKIQSKGTKKISINLGIETIDRIDELAAIFKITRTLILESVIGIGLRSYLETIESANRKIKKQYPEKKELDVMLDNIAKFKNKHKELFVKF